VTALQEAHAGGETAGGLGVVLPIAARHEAATLLSSVKLPLTPTAVTLHGLHTEIDVTVVPQGARFQIAIACRALRDIQVDWSRIWLGVTGVAAGIEPFSPPYLNEDGKTTCLLDARSGTEVQLEASPFSVDVAVQPTVGAVSPPGEPELRPVPELQTVGPCLVRLEYLQDGILDVRVETRDEEFRLGRAHLEFRRPDDTLLHFKTATGEPVAMSIMLDLEDNGLYFGQWIGQVTIPPGTRLRVVAVPRGVE
jgi:hypothetical protein